MFPETGHFGVGAGWPLRMDSLRHQSNRIILCTLFCGPYRRRPGLFHALCYGRLAAIFLLSR